MMQHSVMCRNCGFLAVRNAQTRELFEAEPLFRDQLEVPSDTGGVRYERVPICFARQPVFNDMVGSPIHEILPALHQERECDSFIPWTFGCSPREHREM